MRIKKIYRVYVLSRLHTLHLKNTASSGGWHSYATELKYF
jgi:hypothetical protein